MVAYQSSLLEFLLVKIEFQKARPQPTYLIYLWGSSTTFLRELSRAGRHTRTLQRWKGSCCYLLQVSWPVGLWSFSSSVDIFPLLGLHVFWSFSFSVDILPLLGFLLFLMSFSFFCECFVSLEFCISLFFSPLFLGVCLFCARFTGIKVTVQAILGLPFASIHLHRR